MTNNKNLRVFVCCLILFLSCSFSGFAMEVMSSVVCNKQVDTTPVKYLSHDKIYQPDQVDKQAEFNGGKGSWNKFLERHVDLNGAVDDIAMQTGNIIIGFVVTKNGKLKDLKSLSKRPGETDQRYLQAIKKSPDWIPASIKGKPVDSYVRLSLPYPCISDE
jgi:periplasmic protein TonB